MHEAFALDPWLYGPLTALAVLTGCIDAIAGGGGLLTLPALIYAGLPPHLVLGTNKLQSAMGATVATTRYHRAGLFALRPNLPATLAAFGGAAAGALVIQRFDTHALRLVVPLLLMGAALYTLLSPRMDDAPGKPRITERGYLPVAGGIGFYDGFFGPGTGQFFAATLVGFRGLGLTRATGLTKLLNLASNAASLIVFAAGGQVLLLLGLLMGAGSMLGALIGTRLATRYGARIIRPLLVTASLALTGRLVWGWFTG
ncbi:MAG: TSUP family transporter [Novosphingobium sp.]|uniref:TSUP family transporter n=1 Tax=Novosphingobium sp. TaxID=1874826 RepID=UPI003016CDA9